jgi:hypothetical protein
MTIDSAWSSFWNHLKQQACAHWPSGDFAAKFAAVQEAILDIQNTPKHPDRFHLSKDFQ